MTIEENQCSSGLVVSKDLYVGYGNEIWNTIMIIFSIIGILINSIFTFNYSRQIHSTIKKKSGKDVSDIEVILCTVACIETLISICWLLNNLLMNNTQNMFDHCLACTIIAHVEIFLYLFDWMFLSFSLYQMKKFLEKPVEEKESWKKIIKYIIVCVIISLCSLIFSIEANIGGVSPLLTCFINIQILETYFQYGFFWVFFSFPLLCILSGFILVINIRCSKEYKDKSKREYFSKYAYFVTIYMIYSIILIATYITNWILIKGKGLDKEKSQGYRIPILIITLLSCSSPLVVGLVRILSTGLLKRMCRKKGITEIEEELVKKNEDQSPMVNAKNNIFQQLAMKYFAVLSYTLGNSNNKSKNTEEEEEEEKKKQDTNKFIKRTASIDYTFTIKELLKDNVFEIDNEEREELEQSNINIEIIEFNSYEFKKIRELEGLNQDELLKIFKPQKGIDHLINNKNETLYINSINKLLMLKEIKKDSFYRFQRNIFPGLDEYLSENPDSIICRIFGLYKISIDPENEEQYMALMYNINESLDNQNLKGLNNYVREMKINENELKDNIVTDNNQKDKGKSKIFKINLKVEEKERLFKIIEKDKEFLNSKNFDSKFLLFERYI